MRPVLVLAACLAASPLRAERVIMKDGSVVSGQLLSYSSGFYELQIGKFIKKIPESAIQTVEGDEAAPVRPAPTAAMGDVAIPSAAVASPPATGVPAQAAPVPPAPPAPGPRAAGGAPGMPAMPAMPGMPDLSSLKSLEGLDLKQLGQMTQMLQPLLQGASGPGGAAIPQGSALNEILGGIVRESSVMSQGPEAAAKSPGFRQLHQRLADPAFQQQLVQELRAMQQQTGNAEASGMIQMLEGLMGQLTPPPR